MKLQTLANMFLCLGVLLYPSCKNTGHRDSEDGHDHGAHAKDAHDHADQEARTEDGGHNHAEGDGHDHGHDDLPEVTLSDKAMEIAGITIETVKAGKITKIVELAGEVGLNQDRVANVVPRFPGIVTKVNKDLGDTVEAGEVVAVVESNESLSTYEIKSLISGTVIGKRITLGEFVSEDRTVYVIADLSTVWVNLAVYSKDVPLISTGQTVMIEAIGHGLKTEGTISYIGSVYNEQTRSLTARIVLENPENKWHPGTFVRALVPIDPENESPVVSEEALQTINEDLCVFVPEDGEKNTFRAVKVEVGERDGHHASILSGLSLGDAYVAKGAYELKSKVITSSLGGHAGHGH